MRIFAESQLDTHLSSVRQSIHAEVYREDRNRLLNVNETEYIDYIVRKYVIDAISFIWDQVQVSQREEMIPSSRFPGSFDVYPNKSYLKQIITYHIPYTGDSQLLAMRPSSFIMWSTDVKHFPVRSSTNIGEIQVDIINWRDEPDEIKREFDHIIRFLRQQALNSVEEIKIFNNRLEDEVTSLIRGRKQQLLRESSLLASLGVPIKQTKDVPTTFAVPIQRTTIQVQRPQSSSEPYKPDPVLNEEIYRAILRICRDTGVELERHPSIYAGKDEETLRDHLIMVLSPHFHSVTGETFNLAGKTDILIRHEGKNVFVAECKVWTGSKGHFSTIDQVLSYLTWRDSKAAIVYFVSNKNLDPVFQEIEKSTPSHPCFVKFDGQGDDGWFNYQFHLPEDHTRGVKLAILCFHLPKM